MQTKKNKKNYSRDIINKWIPMPMYFTVNYYKSIIFMEKKDKINKKNV